MTEADQLRSDLLDALERAKLAHHALADGQHPTALVHLDVALITLSDVRARLARQENPPSAIPTPR
jgi:hypothetical protein